MRHLVDHRKLGRTRPHRQALLRNLASSLILHGRIETTLPKAKELRRVADRLVTLGKRGTLDARRRARRMLMGREPLQRLFQEIAPHFASRNGGYTRVLKTGARPGDQSPMALIEYLDFYQPKLKASTAPKEKGSKEAEKKEKKAAAPKKKATKSKK
ncbi:MAG: 50S ribosomal protein L17 [Deltaproteobacteria bacterium]|nr:50S ribosomal protein L17 [Deltaproteobacteria bacterium]